MEDPGWGLGPRSVLVAFVPMLGARMAMRAGNGLVLMRQLWIGFLSTCTLIWIPVIVVWRSGGAVTSPDGRTVAIVVFLAGVVLQLIAGAVVPSPVANEEAAVRATAQKSFFLRIGLAEAAALIGFLGFVVTVNPLVYGAGYLVALAGLGDAAPTVSKIRRIQDDLRTSGSEVDVLTALVSEGLTR